MGVWRGCRMDVVYVGRLLRNTVALSFLSPFEQSTPLCGTCQITSAWTPSLPPHLVQLQQLLDVAKPKGLTEHYFN